MAPMNRLPSLLAATALMLAGSTALALVVKPNVSPEVAAPLPDYSQYHLTTRAIDLTPFFRDPDASAAVRLNTSLGEMKFTLDGETAPITVANFLRYVDEGRYFMTDPVNGERASVFFHRSVPGFIIQSGGFLGTVDPSPAANGAIQPTQVGALPAIQNEPFISNVRGTIAMAKLGGDPNSATSQWFINLANNSSNLDLQNGGFTVFGRVAPGGMAVADAIAALPRFNINPPANPFGALGEVPLRNYTFSNPVRVPNLVSIPEFHRISPFVFTASSSNPAVADVSISGTNLLVTAFGLGAAQITVTATDLDGAAISQSFSVNIIDAPGRLRNISTRARIPAGNEVMIGGFIIRGGTSHRIAVRAIGPSLVDRGVVDALADTTIELHGPGGLIASNDDWQQGADQQLIADLGLAPSSARESVLIATLPGSDADISNYTAIIRSKDGTSGIGLVEVYDLQSSAGSTIRNLSTRGRVATGEPLVGGLIVRGTDPRRLVVRAIGPSLPADVGTRLANPTLQLRDGNGTLLQENDNWETHPNAGEIQNFGLAPGNPNESALVATLPSGEYTAVITGTSGAPAGVALVEVFQVQ
ncbi:hypothetical protein BH20VER1_BH20VER1_19490 [soil metagenome]